MKNVVLLVDLPEAIAIESEGAYISTKERNSLKKTDFLDEKRSSFPIRPGKECSDLEAAIRAWGRYRGSMSHDEFVAKVKSRMNKHGCPLPKSWQK